MHTIAIIGAGFSGTMVAVHLLRNAAANSPRDGELPRASARSLRSETTHPGPRAGASTLPSANGPTPPAEPTHILLFERSGQFTAGVAYATRSSSHVLNVPAGRMSAFSDQPAHFLNWIAQRDPSVTGGSFVQRHLYGQYLAEILDHAQQNAPPHIKLTRVAGEVIDIRDQRSEVRSQRSDGARESAELTSDLRPLTSSLSLTSDLRPLTSSLSLTLDTGVTHHAHRAVLAIGNFPPAAPALLNSSFLESPLYSADPWAPDALDAPPEEPVLLLGTGLTMLDIALALRDRKHTGTIYAVSRRGLLPQPHRRSFNPPPHADRPPAMDAWPRTAIDLLRGLRTEVELAARRGVDWREVVTAIRAETPALWKSLSTIERDRFLRHLRPYWETHRHRAAPGIADDIQTMIDSRWLTILKARVLNAELASPAQVVVTIRRRGQHNTQSLKVARVINCTGPDTDLSRVSEPLIANLRAAGLIRPDAHGLGLDSDPSPAPGGGAVINAHGSASDNLFLVGPLRKGQLWENTAVPELRNEAAAMARLLTTTAPGAHLQPAICKSE